jgi:glycosyltransferase involved in cell wall biosynthesis
VTTPSPTQGAHALLIVENAPVPHDRRVWNEARALQRNGYTVTVLSPRSQKLGLTDSRQKLDGVEIVRFPMPFGGPRKIDFLFEYGWAVLVCHLYVWRIWRKNPIQVVHVANPPDVFFLLKWVLGRFGVRYIFDQHDLSPETYESKFEEPRPDVLSRVLRWLEKRSYAAADAVIVTNESYRERAVGRGGQKTESVFTVRNSPDTALFHQRPPRAELKAGHKHLVAFVGTMGHQDGVHVLLDAAAHVRHVMGRSDVLFAVIGTGDAWDQLQEQHADLGLEEGVRFTGFIPDNEMLDYLATADLGVSPDIDSPLNDISTMIKTMDYMAMGLPVVSFDLTESRVSAGAAAAYAHSHTAEAFGEEIIRLLDSPHLRKKMSRLGRERIAGPLSWSHSGANLLAAYEHALTGGIS